MKANVNVMTDDKDFDKAIMTLGLLAGNPANLQTFIKLYERTLNDTYSVMMFCRNMDKVYEGVYTARGEMLSVVLDKMCKTMDMERPEKREREDTPMGLDAFGDLLP